ncbi:MAG: hypothetical protein IKT41_01045 [Clostridia bacterium]|nr:hypothetical protein [Clostridia bacterium]
MKNKFKLITAFVAVLLMFSSICFATEEQTPIEPRTSEVEQINVTDEAVTTNLETDTEVSEEEQEIYEGDLYIFEDDVNMDKLVDGNVYIIGKNVTISGQVAGNLFVIADNLIIGNENSSSDYSGYVFYNIYALANKATLYSSCYDLYIAGNDISIENSFYLYRDLKMGATNANILGTIGRNVNVDAGRLNLKNDENSQAIIYGNLNYLSANEIDAETLEACVIGETNYSKSEDAVVEESTTSIMSYIETVAIKVIFTVFVWAILLWITPKFLEKAPGFIAKKPVKVLSTGFAALIATPVVLLILLMLIITLPISIIGIALYVLAISIAASLVCIAITYLLKDKLKLNAWYKILGILIGIRIILYLLTLIPFVGGLVSFIILILGLGLIINSMLKNKTEKVDDAIEVNKSEE